MLSDIENLDIILGRDHLEREESVNSNLARRPKKVNSNVSENTEENMYLNPREIRPSNNTGLGQNSTSTNFSAEINRLSSELNSRISSEMDEMMNSVSVQIQRAISDAISNQVLPQIHNALKTGSGHVTQKGWNVPAERPEYIAENYCKEKIRSNSRSEFSRNCLQDEFIDQAYNI